MDALRYPKPVSHRPGACAFFARDAAGLVFAGLARPSTPCPDMVDSDARHLPISFPVGTAPKILSIVGAACRDTAYHLVAVGRLILDDGGCRRIRSLADDTLYVASRGLPGPGRSLWSTKLGASSSFRASRSPSASSFVERRSRGLVCFQPTKILPLRPQTASPQTCPISRPSAVRVQHATKFGRKGNPLVGLLSN